MKIRLSLQIKLVLTTAVVVIFAFSILAYLTIESQRKFFQSIFQNLAINVAQTLEANITTNKDLEDRAKLLSNILKIVSGESGVGPWIVLININLPDNGVLKTVVSNNSILIGTKPSPENFYTYRDGKTRLSKIKGPDQTELLNVITPINIGGEKVGTYEIRLSLQELEETISKTQRQFLITTFISVTFIIFSLYFLMKLTVINPVKEMQLGMKEVGEGHLDFRIKTKRKDEFGDLILGFNQMVDRLQESYHKLKEIQKNLEKMVQERTQKLEEAKSVLEIKVRARTRELKDLTSVLEEKVRERTKELRASQEELQKKIKELEKFQKLAIGRELKMVEMKKKIKELEEKLRPQNQNGSPK